MIHVSGNEIYRGGKKIGNLRGNDVWSYDGNKMGYIEESAGDIFNSSGRKVAWLEGDYIRTVSDRNIRITENNNYVSGGALSSAYRAGIRILLGD